MSDIKELGANGNLVEENDSGRDYLKPYIHRQTSRLNVVPEKVAPIKLSKTPDRKIKNVSSRTNK